MKQVALITGGARGIGYGIATQMAEAGFNLVLCGRKNINELQDKLAPLQDKVKVLYCQCDISDFKQRQSMLQEIKNVFGTLNILINNAGVAPNSREDILNASEESFERLIKINLQGPYFLTQAVAQNMIVSQKTDKNFKGCIINISSISAQVASVQRGDYCISKAGVGMATKLWSARLGEFNIPVYEIRPGVIKTDMTSTVSKKYDSLIEDGLCITKRWGQPEDIGKIATALAKNDLPYCTGQVIMADGGLTLARL